MVVGRANPAVSTEFRVMGVEVAKTFCVLCVWSSLAEVVTCLRQLTMATISVFVSSTTSDIIWLLVLMVSASF